MSLRRPILVLASLTACAAALAGDLHEALDDIAQNIQSGVRARDVFRVA